MAMYRCAFMAVAAVWVAGSAHAQRAAERLQFEVASIRPNDAPTNSMHVQLPSGGKFAAKNVTLKTLIAFAYKVQGFAIEGGPPWMNSARYDVEAKAGRNDLTTEQYWLMLQAL